MYNFDLLDDNISKFDEMLFTMHNDDNKDFTIVHLDLGKIDLTIRNSLELIGTD